MEGNVKTEAEIEVIKLPAKECQQPLAVERDNQTDSPQGPTQGTNFAKTWILAP